MYGYFTWADFRYNSRAVARTLIGGGGCIFIYSGSARLTSFEINFISKETSRARPEYMNIHPPINALATALKNSMYSAACYYVKRSQRIYEKANEYNEDAFRLNVSKNPFKTFEEKAS